MRLKPTFKLRCCGSENESRHSAVNSTVSEYVQTSTIHGVAYVGDTKRNKFERIGWLVMLVFSVFGASYLIYQAYRTMRENPIIESPSLTRIPIWEVPFPAVTICLPNSRHLTPFALNKTNWPDFARNLSPENVTGSGNFLLFDSGMLLPTLLLRDSGQNNYDNYDYYDNYDNYNILSQVLPHIDMAPAIYTSISGESIVLIQRIITRYGLCVTFNMYDEKEILRDGVALSSIPNTYVEEQQWNRDSGFNNHMPVKNYVYPFRSFDRDDLFTAKFTYIDTNRSIEFQGFYKIVIHAPDEFPLFGRHSETIVVTPGEHYRIKVAPRLVVSEGIEHYTPEVRQCYYSNERYLQFYKNYTQGHCEWECLANYTMTQCGCIPYHFPHFGDAKLCSTKFEFTCVVHKESYFFCPNFTGDDGRAPVDDCKCFPSCTQLWYRPELTSSLNKFYLIWLTIENKFPHLEKHVRTELHSISEFFSNCGGSLGLFLGVSIFSIMELLYFCTIRLYWYGKKGSNEQISRNPENKQNHEPSLD